MAERITDVNGREVELPFMDDKSRHLFWDALAAPNDKQSQAIALLCRHVYFMSMMEVKSTAAQRGWETRG